MKNKLFVFVVIGITGWSLFGCGATTTFIVKKPTRVTKTYHTASGDSTVVVNELLPVFALETNEKTVLGTSRTTVREMAFSYRATQEGEVLGATADAFRKKGDRVIDYVERAPLPGNPRDWRQMFTYKDSGVYRNSQGRYWYGGQYLSDFQYGVLKGEAGIRD